MANKELFSLGELYVSDFLEPGVEATLKHELALVMDESIGAARLKTTIPVGAMFGKYWYKSGTNSTMKNALADVVHSIYPHIKSGGKWLDVASNDGTLLKQVPASFEKYGVDPCEGEIYTEARKHGEISKDYFKKELFDPEMKFDVITTVAMFYDLENPDPFIEDIYEVLDDEGIWVIQMSYTPLMIKQLAFDNILSEHVYYHSLSSMRNLMERNGFRIVDCTLNDVNGGSFRIFVRKKISNPKNFGTQAYRDVCKYRMASLQFREALDGIEDRKIWEDFYKDILMRKAEIMHVVETEKRRGRTIMGYGASTKGNTLLQFFGLNNTHIDAIAERQPEKWGLRTVGSNIPIISEEEMRKAQPDYLLILPWHFIAEFEKRESEYLKKGGKFIVPLPRFEILPKSNLQG